MTPVYFSGGQKQPNGKLPSRPPPRQLRGRPDDHAGPAAAARQRGGAAGVRPRVPRQVHRRHAAGGVSVRELRIKPLLYGR